MSSTINRPKLPSALREARKKALRVGRCWLRPVSLPAWRRRWPESWSSSYRSRCCGQRRGKPSICALPSGGRDFPWTRCPSTARWIWKSSPKKSWPTTSSATPRRARAGFICGASELSRCHPEVDRRFCEPIGVPDEARLVGDFIAAKPSPRSPSGPERSAPGSESCLPAAPWSAASSCSGPRRWSRRRRLQPANPRDRLRPLP